MAISRVQAADNTNGGGTGAFSVTISSTTSSNFLAVIIGHYTNSGTAPTATDNLGSSYSTGYALIVGSAIYQSVLYLENIPSGITSVTVTPGTSQASAIVLEYSGIATSSSLGAKVTALADNGGGTSWSSNNIAPSGGTWLLLGVSMTRQSGNANFVSTGAWGSVRSGHDGSDGDDLYAQEQLNVADGTYAASGTADSHVYYTGAISFKAAAATGGVVGIVRQYNQSSNRAGSY